MMGVTFHLIRSHAGVASISNAMASDTDRLGKPPRRKVSHVRWVRSGNLSCAEALPKVQLSLDGHSNPFPSSVLSSISFSLRPFCSSASFPIVSIARWGNCYATICLCTFCAPGFCSSAYPATVAVLYTSRPPASAQTLPRSHLHLESTTKSSSPGLI